MQTRTRVCFVLMVIIGISIILAAAIILKKPYIVERYEKTPFEQSSELINKGERVRNRTYYKLSDGTWECGGYSYKFRQELSGRMPAAIKDSTFVYLTNQEITFEQAWKGIVGGAAEDMFAVEDAVLVEMQ